MRQFSLLVALVCSLAIIPSAHLLSQELPLHHYTTKKEINPLPAPAITTLFQDSEGYIWMSVYGNSLVRYDGSEMELFDNNLDGVPTSLWAMTQDAKGRLWVGTYFGLRASDKSLNHYAIGERPRFLSQVDSVLLMGQQIPNPAQILVDKKGRIWAASKNLLIRYDYTDNDQLFADTLLLDGLTKETGLHIYGLLERKNGHVCGITDKDYLLEFTDDGQKFQYTRVEIAPPAKGNIGLSTYLLEDDAGNLSGFRNDGLMWQVTSKDSIYRTKNFPRTPGQALTMPIKLSNGRILAGSIGGGLTEWEQNQPEKHRLYTTGNGLLNMVIWDIMQDREGNIWLATNSGLSRMPGDYAAFGHYTSTSLGGLPNVLPDNGVNGLLADMTWKATPSSSEKLLVAATVQGLSFIRSDGSREIVQLQHGLHNNAIMSLFQDMRGRLWATGRGGVTCISQDPSLLDLPGFSKPIAHQLWGAPVYLSKQPGFNTVAATSFDFPLNDQSNEKEEIVWLIGNNYLLCLIGDQSYIFQQNTGIGTYMVTAETDDQGYLYLGCMQKNLLRSKAPLTHQKIRSLNTKKGGAPGYEQAFQVLDSFFIPYPLTVNGDTILQVSALQWVNDLMWVGTPSGGYAFKIDSTEISHQITLQDTLQSQFYQTMVLSNDSSTLWLSTRTGLVAADPISGSVLNTVDARNGLVADKTWGYHALDIDSEGVLYFGTPDGLSIYSPHLDGPDTIAPLLSFRQFRLEQDNWGNNELIVKFAGLSFYDEKGTKYQTRLQGYDRDWSEISIDNRIRYTNLPAFFFPKTYTFEVKAHNIYGTWSSMPISHQFSILPPLWLRWWVVLGYLTLLSFLIWLLIKWRTRYQEAALAKERQIIDQLRQVDALKDQFLANTSHELRTPLNGIIGLSEALADSVPDPVHQSDLKLIVSSGKRLANLVNDILDFSKLKNDQLVLQLSPVDMHALTNVILALTQPLLGEKPIELINEIPQDIPLVEADENRVQQILHNLIGNAIKFTPKGCVTIFGTAKDELLEITVSDTGIGIAPEKFDDIFRAFEQADGSTARMYGGTGLGLAVTRQLVEAHGGNISLTSTLGEGSHFTFSLPISQTKRETTTKPGSKTGGTNLKISNINTNTRPQAPSVFQADEKIIAPPLSGVFQILIVDDEPINLRVLKNHLSKEGYQVTTADNGFRALEILRSNKQFDLIILDIMMPRMSGYEVCQELRNIFLPSELPVVMLTAKNRVNDLVDGFNAGANDYLTKPFSKDELLSRIKTHLHLHHINQATGKFVPNEFLRSIGRESITEVQLGDLAHRDVTVFFSDIRSFTTLVETMTPEEAFKFVNAYNRRIGPVIQQYDGFVNQYLGDGIMALFMGTIADSLRSAIEMQQAIRTYNVQREEQSRIPIRVGMGLHTGPLIMGVIGDQNRLNPAIVADTVNTAARIENLTKHYGVNILLSEDILSGIPDQSEFRIRSMGKFLLKGKQEPLAIYECFDGDDPATVQLKMDTLELYEQGAAHFFAQQFFEAKVAFNQVLSINSDDQAAKYFLEKSETLIEEGVPDGWTGVVIMTVK